jgi:hypothetical protein
MVKAIAEKMPLIAQVTSAVDGFLSGVRGVIDHIAGVLQSAQQEFSNRLSILQANAGSGLKGNSSKGKNKTKKEGNAKGLPYVPYDGYETILHKGERVLTAQQNRQYNNKNASSITIPKLADTIVIKEEMDIDKLATRFVKKLKTNMLSYGGAY